MRAATNLASQCYPPPRGHYLGTSHGTGGHGEVLAGSSGDGDNPGGWSVSVPRKPGAKFPAAATMLCLTILHPRQYVTGFLLQCPALRGAEHSTSHTHTTHQKERKETTFLSLTTCGLSSDYWLRQSSHGEPWAPYTWQPFGSQGREFQSRTSPSGPSLQHCRQGKAEEIPP